MTPILVKQTGVHTQKNVRFHGMPIISLFGDSVISIGESCVICSDTRMTALGLNHRVVMRTLRQGAKIVIGRNTGMSGGVICAASRVEIGDDCLIGANVVISDTDFHSLNPVGRRENCNWDEIVIRPVVIEDNVFIGTGAIVLKGVTIGKNSVIGAGAVVTKNIPQSSVAAGNPARVIRTLRMDHAHSDNDLASNAASNHQSK